MTVDRTRPMPVEELLANRHWPRAAAEMAFVAWREERVNDEQLRLLDRWLAFCSARGITMPTVEDFLGFGPLEELEALGPALAHLQPEGTTALRLAKRRLRSERWRRAKATVSAFPASSPRRQLAVETDELPLAWRRQLDRLHEAAAARDDDIVSLDETPAYAGAVLRSIEHTLALLAWSARRAGLPVELSVEAINALLADLEVRGRRPATKAARCKELHRFGLVIGADRAALNRAREAKNAFAREASRTRKRKEVWLQQHDVTIGDVFARAEDLAAETEDLPAGGAEAFRRRMDAALLALSVNAPLRCGDLHSVVLGRTLIRDAEGWRLALETRKTGLHYESDQLWPEVAVILDAYLLDGAPAEQLWRRVAARDGTPFFSFDDGATGVAIRWPSKVWQRHFGTGEHIVRTLWHQLTYLTAPDKVWMALALCGQASERTAEEYRMKAGRRAVCGRAQSLMRAARADLCGERNGMSRERQPG